MFYFLIGSAMAWRWLLIASAVIPAVFLMVKVYRSDRLEKESWPMLRRLIIAGVLSTLPALVLEKLGSAVLPIFARPGSIAYNVLLYFVVVGVSEEVSKYFLMKRVSWKSPEFNCRYDGVVYAVFVSLGFALWENVQYVLTYGFSTALVRAVTAIPGHACFGVFMGILYGEARSEALYGKTGESKLLRVLSVLIPVLLHGTYDYIASMERRGGEWIFLLFVGALFFLSFRLIGRSAKKDRYL